MGGASSRRKGHSFERKVAQRMREAMPGVEIKRGLQSRGGGAEEADVEMPFLHVECKIGKRPSPRAALSQAVRDAKPGKIPIAVVQDDRQEPFVVLRLDDFLDALNEWFTAGGGMDG